MALPSPQPVSIEHSAPGVQDAEDGLFPASLDDWETTVLNTELARNDYVAWYRNPRRGYESFGIRYAADKSVKIMRPDFCSLPAIRAERLRSIS